MTTWPLTLTGEILIDGAWQSVPMRTDPKITITRGGSSEGSRAQPGKCTVTLDNRDGTYSPRNPNSSLFGKIGRNTPFRFRVDDLPADPAPVLADTFNRTEINGWGVADTGQTWVIYDPFGTSPPASAYSVSNGTGRISPTFDASRNIRASGLAISDMDATFTVMTEERAQGDNGEGAVFASFLARINVAASSFYRFNVGFRVDTGLPGNTGLRVAVNMVRFDNLEDAILNRQKSVPGLTYEPGVPLRVRVQCVGPHLRMRVWADGSTEPQAWHSQAYDEAFTTGEVGFMSVIGAAPDTAVPFDVHFGNLQVRQPAADPGVNRLRGEIPAWPPRRHDESGNDLTTPIEPAGLLRRLGTGAPLLKSPMRRHIPALFPLAYYPLEEGRQGDVRAADATLNANAGLLVVQGMEFAKDSDLLGSASLPTLTDNARMSSPAVPGKETGSWSVSMMFRISESNFPTDATEHQILRFLTAGSAAVTWVVSLELSGTSPTMRVRAFDADGVQLDNRTAGHDAAVAAGAPGLLDDWRRLRVRAVEVGADLNWRFDWIDLDGSTWGNGATLTSTGAGRPSRISTTFGSGVKGMALGHLSMWGVQFEAAYLHTGQPAALGGAASTQGLRGETTRAFLDRLGGQEGIALEITGPAEERLGPVPSGTFLDLVQQAAATEMGLLTEDRSALGLEHRARETLYNQGVALTLDYSNGQIFDPFDPTDDDKDIRNEITAKRREGSEATAVLEEGPLAVQPPPEGIGRYATSVETIVDSDNQLPDQAGWRLHVATADEMRVTKLHLKMGNPRMRALIDDVLRLDVGSRIQIINLPDDLPPDGFDLLIMGYREEFGVNRWDITFTCVPASPWQVGVLEDAEVSRADTDGSELATAVDADDTSLLAHTTSGPYWTEDPADVPLDVRVGGEVLTVSEIEPGAWDQFTRTVANSWGTSSSGLVWTEAGGVASDRSVNGTRGVITLAANPGTIRFQQLLPGLIADCEVRVRMSVSQVATGASFLPSVLLRTLDTSNYYRARVHFDTSGGMFASITRGITQIGTTTTLATTYTAGAEFEVRVRLTGHTIRMRVWPVGAEEPSVWHHEETITADLIAAGTVGVTGSAFATNTNVSPELRYDEFSVVTPQRFTVVRSVNKIVKPHGAGTDARLATPTVVAL